MHKVVNGHDVPLTPEEVEEFQKNTLDHIKKMIDNEKVKYLSQRAEKKFSQGITNAVLIDAIWKKLSKNNSTEFDALQLQIESIDQEFPEPSI